MKTRGWIVLLIVALALSLQFDFSQAQEAAPGSEEIVIEAETGGYVPVQGRLTSSSGSPLNGTYSIAVRLYNTASGGTALCSVLQSVAVTNGLFTLLVPCGSAQINGQQLYAGIQVGSDAEMTPRLPIYPAPYAYSLRPGAIIANTSSGKNSLKVTSSAGGGGGDASLWVENSSPASGIALWSKAAGFDASVVIENAGSGPLLKAFGGDGGEDEVLITNQGALQIKADTYLFVPGSEVRPTTGNPIINYYGDGSVALQYTTTGVKGVMFGIPLPAVLYGQPVEVEEITIFYNVSNSATYIDATDVYKQLTAGAVGGGPDFVYLLSDTTNRASIDYTSYTLSPTSNAWLSAETGFIGVGLAIQYNNTLHYLNIGGVRVRLGHHPLY